MSAPLRACVLPLLALLWPHAFVCPRAERAIIVATTLEGVPQCLRVAAGLNATLLNQRRVLVHILAVAPEATPRVLRPRASAMAERLLANAASTVRMPLRVTFRVAFGMTDVRSPELAVLLAVRALPLAVLRDGAALVPVSLQHADSACGHIERWLAS